MRIFLTCLLLYPFTLTAQWNTNEATGTVVANSTLSESYQRAVSDGANGCIEVFTVTNEANERDIYAQRITQYGELAWGSSNAAIKVCDALGHQDFTTPVADGNGGVFVAWQDARFGIANPEIYMQHISASGTALWTSNGLRVTNSLNYDFNPKICSDEQGGVIIVWTSNDNTTNFQAYAQRYNSSGTPQWAAGGLQLCTAAGFRAANALVPDGANGAILSFIDTRNDPHGTDFAYLQTHAVSNYDIYAQRINSNGSRLWTNDGMPLCVATGNQDTEADASAVIDNNGGMMLLFEDFRNESTPNTNRDIYAQRINSSGAVLWGAAGLAVNTAAGNQNPGAFVADGAGGIVMAFLNEPDERIYAQRIAAGGSLSWTANGIALTQSADLSTDAALAADGAGNFVVAYKNSSDSSIRAQKLNDAGAVQWGGTGVLVCRVPLFDVFYPALTQSDNNKIILCWMDTRLEVDNGFDLYACKLKTNGTRAASAISRANGSWTDAATWLNGVLPVAAADVLIKHAVTANTNAACNTLRVKQGGSFSANSGVLLQVSQ